MAEPDLVPKFKVPTINEVAAFTVGAFTGVGDGLLIYSSTANPSAGADQKIGEWRSQVHDIQHGLTNTTTYPYAEQRAAGSMLLRHFGTAENNLEASIAQRPTSPDTSAKEIGTVIEGMAGTGLLFAVAVAAFRGLRHMHRVKKARAFEKEVTAGLSKLHVDTPERKQGS